MYHPGDERLYQGYEGLYQGYDRLYRVTIVPGVREIVPRVRVLPRAGILRVFRDFGVSEVRCGAGPRQGRMCQGQSLVRQGRMCQGQSLVCRGQRCDQGSNLRLGNSR